MDMLPRRLPARIDMESSERAVDERARPGRPPLAFLGDVAAAASSSRTSKRIRSVVTGLGSSMMDGEGRPLGGGYGKDQRMEGIHNRERERRESRNDETGRTMLRGTRTRHKGIYSNTPSSVCSALL